MSKLSLLCLITGILLILSGCSSNTESNKYDSIPHPAEGSCVIYGTLLNSEREPINEPIFLSRNLTYEEPDLPATVSFSYQSDPKGEINLETGVFFFDNVVPGENYVITVYTGSGAPLVVKDFGSDLPLLIKVDAGESLNLGELIIDIYY